VTIRQHRLSLHNDEITQQGEDGASTQRLTIDRRNHWLFQVDVRSNQVAGRLNQRWQVKVWIAVYGLDEIKVASDGEGSSGASDDSDVDGVVFVNLAQDGGHLFRQKLIHGVHLVGAIERNERNSIATFNLQVFELH
jgi:hypothetical protein